MESTKARLDYLDEENAHLGDPVNLPSGTTPIFLRLPGGLARADTYENSPDWKWLVHYIWADKEARIPPFEVRVGVMPPPSDTPGEQSADLTQRVKDFFALSNMDEPQLAEEVQFTNLSGVPGTGQPIRYQRMQVNSTEAIPNLIGRLVYKWDIYLFEQAGLTVMFKELDVEATKSRWQDLARQDQTKLNEMLPTQALAELGRQRELSLASLLTGGPAPQRAAALRGGG